MSVPPLANWSLRQVNEERAAAIAGFGFTERQARFLVTVMLQSGVFVERQYCAFAHIVHGQKPHDFLRKLVERRYATAHRVGRVRSGRMFHVGHKPLYAALGQTDNRHRKPAAVARMVERLMLLDAVLDDPGRSWLGTEQDKREHFTRHLAGRLEASELPQIRFGGGGRTTVRYFPDKLPIGVDTAGTEYVFVYLVASPVPMDFRLFLLRHAELLRAVERWTIRLLVPMPFTGAVRRFEAAARDHFATPLPPAAGLELEWFFSERKRRETSGGAPPDERFIRAFQAFQAPRFRALYRHWQVCGNAAIWATASPSLKDALARGDGRLEVVPLTRQYLHLASMVGTA